MGFDDLVAEAMPHLATEEISGAAGASWEWSYVLTDAADAPVDLTSVTGEFKMAKTLGGTSAVSATVTCSADGVVKVTATPSATSTVAPGTYFHEVVLTNAAGRKVYVVGGGESRFIVKGDV